MSADVTVETNYRWGREPPPTMVPDALLAVGGIATATALGFRLYGRLVAGDDPKRATKRLRRAFSLGFPASVLATLVALLATDGTAAMIDAVDRLIAPLPAPVGPSVGAGLMILAHGLPAVVPGRRHLFVTDELLAEFDDVLRVVLAIRTAKARRLYLERKLCAYAGTHVLAGGVGTGAFPAPEGWRPWLVAGSLGGRRGGALVDPAGGLPRRRRGRRPDGRGDGRRGARTDRRPARPVGRARTAVASPAGQAVAGNRIDRLWKRAATDRPAERGRTDATG